MPDKAAPPIAVEGLRLRYPQDGRVVLHGVELTLRRGEVKLLLGPSGAGKSSLALTLNGLIPHAMDGELRGRVLVNGIATEDSTLPALTAQVGMLFQDPESQIATLTVADEVAFGMENLQVTPSEMPARISLALRRVGLEGLEARGTDALSGGQKQRLALASTLAMGVSILVFDEPTANLDPAGTRDFFGLLGRLKAEGASILIIEHKLDELVEQVDSIALLDWDGKIALDGPTREALQDGRDLLEKLGVWLPQVCELANALDRCGLPLRPCPLTVREAAFALDAALPPGWTPPSMAAPPAPGKSEAPPAILIEGLSYQYPTGAIALRNVNLRVSEGSFYALVGPNGSGKTTLARHLIGLLRPQHGRIEVRGENITGIPASRLNREIGYVFQNPEHQFVALTVADELAFSLRALKLPETEIAPRIERLMQEFGLDRHTQSNPYTLSQGQKRRLSVATMLALQPGVLILDEPTFGQDRENAVRIMDELKRLNEAGTTIIVITHDMKLVAEYARDVGALVGGETLYEGTPEGLFGQEGLIREARLQVPPLYKLSQAMEVLRPGFPRLATVRGYLEALCRDSAMSQAAVTSTA